MKKQHPLDRLRKFVAQHGTQTAAARALNISLPYLNDILNGRRGFSDTVLAKLGLERVTTVVEKAS